VIYPLFYKANGVNENLTYYVRSSSIPQSEIKEATVSFLAAGFVVPRNN
jgi:hypothetical protein